MYKIYINEKPFILVDSISIKDSWHAELRTVVAPYLGKTKQLLQYMDMLRKSPKCDRVVIHHHDKKFLKRELLKLVKEVPAGGGLVFNQKGELLVIFRRGFWDLPKGKIETGETNRLGAMREVMEETGIQSVRIINKLTKTYHLFKNKSGKRALKLSHWFVMESDYKETLIPQVEEDIEIVEWVKPQVFLKKYDPIFRNIKDVVELYLKQKNTN